MPAGVRICFGCERRLAGWLRAIPDLLEDLEITITRQDHIGSSRVGGKSSETPLMFNERASKAKTDLIFALRYWSAQMGRTWRRLTPEEYAHFLVTHMHAVRIYEDAGELYREVDRAVRKARQAIDRPAERVFAGPCNTEVQGFGGTAFCSADLYARPGKSVVVCRECGTEHDVPTRREWMLSEVRNYDADAALMSSILAGLGFKIDASTIRRYGAEGLLSVMGVGPNGAARYNIGQVLDTFAVKQERKKSGKKSA